jgi:hypothetical protein
MSSARPLLMLAAAAMALAAAPAAARAQWRLTVDVGSATSSEGARAAIPLLVDGSFLARHRGLLLAARATTTPASPVPGGLFGSLMTEVLAGGPDATWRGGLTLRAAAGQRTDLFDESRREIEAGPIVSTGSWTAAARFGAARLDDWDARAARSAELFLRRDLTRGRVTVSGRQVTYADTQTYRRDTTYVVAGFEFESSVTRIGRGDHRYVDAQTIVDWSFGRSSWTLNLGTRVQGGDPFGRRWGSVSALLPLRAGLAIVAAAGRTAGVPEQRYVQSGFATLALRVADLSSLIGGDAAGVARFDVSGGAGGTRLVRLHNVRARTVEVSGDFTNWEAIPLASEGRGLWQRAVALAPGVHRVLIRTDGGEWHAPPGLPITSDGFGGDVGMLFVE